MTNLSPAIPSGFSFIMRSASSFSFLIYVFVFSLVVLLDELLSDSFETRGPFEIPVFYLLMRGEKAWFATISDLLRPISAGFIIKSGDSFLSSALAFKSKEKGFKTSVFLLT